MTRPPPIRKVRAIPARIDRTRWRRSAGFAPAAAAVCAAKRLIQKLLMDHPKFMSLRDLSMFCSPLRTGAAHIVRFGPVPTRWIGHCGPPSIGHSSIRLENSDAENLCEMRELLKHDKSSVIRSSNMLIRAYEFERDRSPAS